MFGRVLLYFELFLLEPPLLSFSDVKDEETERLGDLDDLLVLVMC